MEKNIVNFYVLFGYILNVPPYLAVSVKAYLANFLFRREIEVGFAWVVK